MVTGGMHSTSDDLFIAMEMSARQKDKDETEKNKKLRLQLQAVEEKAIAIMAHGKSINSLTVAELDVLLSWHQAKPLKLREQKRRTSSSSGSKSWSPESDRRIMTGGRLRMKRG